MWDKIIKYQAGFHSAVITIVDRNGFPASWRTKATVDQPAQCIRLELPAAAELFPGPASLLFHSLDEHLWNLRSFIVKGRAVYTPEGWVLLPEKVIPGVSVEGPMGYVKFLWNGQKGTQRFFKKRGMRVPRINWDDVVRFLMPG